ncbi:MAG: hypothetical protein H0T46_19535, partial [Deltaproteobacteria bacterium]|nr:hypothetical protein [Deltaproteobacteria bacterium]
MLSLGTADAAPAASPTPLLGANASPSPTSRSPSPRPDTGGTVEIPDALRLKPEGDAPAARPAAPETATMSSPEDATARYFLGNVNQLWRAVASQLASASWPTPSEQLTWQHAQPFSEALGSAMKQYVMERASKADIALAPLDELLYPVRVHDELGAFVPVERDADGKVTHVNTQWSPALGLRFAQLVHTALVSSAQRMTTRYVDAMNARREQAAHEDVRLSANDLITSRPIDRLVAHALVTPIKGGQLVVSFSHDAAAKPKGRTSLRSVRLTWEGSRDPRFWCWVRADLPDATPEEVAAALFAYAKDKSGDVPSFYAYGFANAAPLFGLPASWAIAFPEARAHAPEDIKGGKLPDPATDTIARRLMMLAASDTADTLALHQAAGAKLGATSGPAVLTAVEDTLLQLEALRSILTPWGVAGDIFPVIMHAVRKRDALRAAPANEVIAYAGVAFGQRDRLSRIAGSIAAAIDAGGQLGSARDASNPVRGILERYAQAAASAQLGATSEQLIEEAQAMQRGLVIKSLQTNQLAAMHEMSDLQAGPAVRDPKAAPADDRDWMEKQIDELEGRKDAQRTVPRTNARAARELGRPYNDVQDRARMLESTLLAGGEVDADELQRVQLESQEIALRARLENLTAHMDVIDAEAAEATKGLAAKIASLGSSKFRELRDVTGAVRAALVLVRRDLIIDQREAKPRAGDADGLTPPPVDISIKREALTKAQAQFTKLSADHELGTFLERAYDVIESQRFRTMLVNFAAQLGIGFAAGGMASVLTKGMGRAFTTAKGVQDVAQLSRGARAGMVAVRVATDTIANTAGQVALTGEDPWKALVQNALVAVGMEGTTSLVVRDVAVARAWSNAFAEQVGRIESVEAKAAMRASKAGMVARLVGREAIGISGHAVMGMALGSISQRLIAQLDGQGTAQGAGGDLDTEALLQMAAVGIGRLVHARSAQRRASLEELARQSGSAEGRLLAAHAQQLEALSERLLKAPDAERALEVLDHQQRLIDEELRVIDELIARTDHGGYSADDLARTRAELVSQRGNAGDTAMLAVKLHLSGLRELAPGTLWSGTPEDVARGVKEIRATRPDAQVREEPGSTTVRVGDQVMVLHVVEAGAPAVDTRVTAARTTGDERMPGAAPVVNKALGEQIAGRVPGVRYETGGAFKLATEVGEVTVRIRRRSSGGPRVVHEGNEVVIEVPVGIDEATLREIVAEQLTQARDSAHGTRESAVRAKAPEVTRTEKPDAINDGGKEASSGAPKSPVDIDPGNDIARLQTKGIETAIAEGQSKFDWNARSKDGTHSVAEIYKAWIEGKQPVDFSGKEPHANFSGDETLRPYFDEFRPIFDGIVKNPSANVTLNAKAKQNASAIGDLKLSSLDPTNPNYYVDRAKLVEKLGPAAVARYESQVLNLSTESQTKVREKVRMVVPDEAIAQLRSQFPDAEIYIYGSSAQPNKKDLTLVKDIDVMLVLPDGTPGTRKAELENIAKSMTLPTTPEFAAATNKTELPLDVSVRTKSDAVGLMTMEPGTNPKTNAPRTPLEYARVDEHQGIPITPAERDVLASAFDKVGKGESPSNAEMAELTRMIALGKIDPKRLPAAVKDKLPNHAGTDAAAIKQWAHELANSTPESEKMTPEQAKADTDEYLKRKQEVDELYEGAMNGTVPMPAGVSKERLRLAVKGDPETGERVPLSYGADAEKATNLLHQFEAELKAVFDSENITDVVVVQVGSGTTGWSNAPGKTGKPFSNKSDVDFAIFSDQALEQAMKQNVPINDKNKVSGKYTTLANNPDAKKGRLTGLHETSLGAKLKKLSRRWNQIVFNDPTFDGFDLKLNLDTEKPFRSAVPVVQMETPVPITSPETSGTRAILVDGRSKFLGVPLKEPKMTNMIPEQTVGRREYHITVVTPPEYANLSAESRTMIESGVDIPGTPRGRNMAREDFNGMN